MQRFAYTALATLTVALTGPAASPAQTAGAESWNNPCHGQPAWAPDAGTSWDDFNFLLGDWIVTDAESGEIIGFERYERVMQDCVILHETISFRDRLRAPGSPLRYNAETRYTLTSMGQWRMSYMDNMSGNLIGNGVADTDHDLEFLTEWMAFPEGSGYGAFRWRVMMDALEDGSVQVRSVRQAGNETAEWTAAGNSIYRPNR